MLAMVYAMAMTEVLAVTETRQLNLQLLNS